MFVVRDKKTGKYLRSFSSSYSSMTHMMRYRLTKPPLRPQDISTEQIRESLFTEDDPINAKIYKTRGGAAGSIGRRARLRNGQEVTYHRHRRYLIPIEEESYEILRVIGLQVEDSFSVSDAVKLHMMQ